MPAPDARIPSHHPAAVEPLPAADLIEDAAAAVLITTLAASGTRILRLLKARQATHAGEARQRAAEDQATADFADAVQVAALFVTNRGETRAH